MSFLKLITFIIKLLTKKLFLRNDLNNPRWFPIKKDGDFYEGFNKPLFCNKDMFGFFVRYYKTNFSKKNLINFILNFSREFFFKFEIIKGKINNENFNIKTGQDSILPLASLSEKNSTMKVESKNQIKKINLLPDKFTYLKLDKNVEYNFNIDNNFIVGKPLEIFSRNQNNYNLVLMIFLDGFTFSENESFFEFCPNIKKFFENGVVFKNNFCNAEWTLPSFPSHFCGLRQQNHGFYHNKRFHIFREDIKVLPELFKEKNYLNFFLNSNPRANPKYGYIRGFDRTIHKLNYEFDDMCNDVDDHLSVFKNRDNFIMMNVFDLHETDKNLPPFENQANLNMDYLTQYPKSNKNKRIPLKDKKYVHNKVEIDKYLINLKRVDRIFSRLVHSIEKFYPKGKSLITIVTDHGTQYTESTSDLLSKSRMRVPWLLKADDIAPAEINDFTENVDVFSSILKICNLNKNGNLNAKFKNHFTGENNTDSILPGVFGGSKKRDFVFMQSIYDRDPYFAKVLDNEIEYTLTSDRISEKGIINIEKIKKEIKILNKGINDNSDKIKKYEKFCIEQINNWNVSIKENKFKFYEN